MTLGEEERAPTLRAVVIVPNTFAPYSRGLRVARSLAAEGFEVTVAAMAADDLPLREQDGLVSVRRFPPTTPPHGTGARGATASSRRGDRNAVAGPLHSAARASDRVMLGLRRRAASRVPVAGRLPVPTFAAAARVLRWPAQDRAWWAWLHAKLPPADLYHACGYRAIGVALDLASDARRAGRAGRVVYDVIDAYLDSNAVAGVAAPVVWFWRGRERRWARGADAVVTVNEPLAEHLQRTWDLGVAPTVLLNCPERWTPPLARPDLIRAATGIPPDRRIVLHLGKLVREKGVEEAAEAVLLLPDAALVLLGFGRLVDAARARSEQPRFRGRHFLLPPAHPDDLPAWTASADVTLVGMPGGSLNQRLAAPNKFWESLAAGTPVVVGRDLVYLRGLVEREGLGAVADPTDAHDLARAFRAVLERPVDERERLRARCLRLAHERYHWGAVVLPYLSLVRTLTADGARPA